MQTDPAHDAQDPAGPGPVIVPDPQLRTIALVRWGVVVWAVALVVLLALPSLTGDGRQWWVWVPVAGIVLGAVGHVYLWRGRGNAQLA